VGRGRRRSPIPQGARQRQQLIAGEKVDILTGPVHSGVAMAMMQNRPAGERADHRHQRGAQAVTGTLCHSARLPHLVPQLAGVRIPASDVMLKAGHKRAVLMFWNYSFGQESMPRSRRDIQKSGVP